jgi:hypothetical protein
MTDAAKIEALVEEEVFALRENFTSRMQQL